MAKSSKTIDGISVTILSDIDDAKIANALRGPTQICAETGTEDFLQEIKGVLVLVLTTATAFTTDPATIVADIAIERNWIPAPRRSDLRLALHEALANGLLHGNLGLAASHNAQNPGDFMEHARLLEERLAQPEYGGKPIAISLSWNDPICEIAICDSGEGFTPGPRQAKPGERLGEGLNLIASHCDHMRFEAGGRRLILAYLPETPDHDHA